MRLRKLSQQTLRTQLSALQRVLPLRLTILLRPARLLPLLALRLRLL